MKKNNVVRIEKGWEETKVLLISDLHWDNPKCDRELLKKHLDEALKGNHDILINGDLFCLMQGAYDPRKSKSDIRPEHNSANYFDAIINTAVDWFTPYAHLIKLVAYGNHETAILKRQETDIIERFVTLLNYKTGSDIQVGGYGGWIRIQFNDGNTTQSFKIKYMHGFGGGGAVTRGTIQHNRMSVNVEGADAIWMGHVHEDYEMTYTVEELTTKDTVQLRDILMIRTSAYKEEYGDGSKGWHIERGASPKPIGGRWLILKPFRDKATTRKIHAYTHKTL
jgi:UDP-2,3-diacylglucosamine pyrophosphatase LpxH